MAREPYRASMNDLGRGERWGRDRFVFEQEQGRYRDRDRYADERVRIDDRGERLRVDEHDERVRIDGRDDRVRIDQHDERVVRDQSPARGRRTVYEDDRRYYQDEARYVSPPPRERDVDRHVVFEQERQNLSTRAAPPTLVRRRSSLDSFDRRPPPRFYERDEREQYGPPARREDFRAPPNVPIPLPRTRPPPPPVERREFMEEIRVSEPEFYGDDDYRAYPAHERELVRTHQRNRSRESRGGRAYSRHGSSVRSSSRTSSATSSTNSVETVKSAYPKKGKTRIPSRLVSKRALVDLNYPFVEEGNTIVVFKALGQNNIDDLLKVSENYFKSEAEMVESRSNAGPMMHERREEIYMTQSQNPGPIQSIPPPPVPMSMPPAPQPAPVVIHQSPQTALVPAASMSPAPNVVDVVPPAATSERFEQRTYIRDVSPSRSSSATMIVESRPRREIETSGEMPIGPMALVATNSQHRRSHSADIKAEIRALQAELKHRERYRERRSSVVSDRESTRVETLPSGEMVVYEERVEKVEPHRGVRIERDKRGRMTISVPKYR